MPEITHRQDGDGTMRQIVCAARLREVLAESGDTTERPVDWRTDDEWLVVDEV